MLHWLQGLKWSKSLIEIRKCKCVTDLSMSWCSVQISLARSTSGVGLIHTNPNWTVWELKSWRVFWTHPSMSLDFLKLHGTSSELLLAATATHTHKTTHAHTHTTHYTHSTARTHTEIRAQKLHYKHLLPWMSLKVLSTFTIFVKIFYPHQCPQKLVFNILLKL